MWDSIISILSERYPMILLCIVLIVAVWLIAKFYYTRFKKTEKIVSELPCEAHSLLFKQISDDLLQIRTYIQTKDPKNAALFSVKQSPRRLNQAGEQLYNDFNGEAFLDANSAMLIRAIDEKKPKTALDVEVASHEVLVENVHSDIFNGLKNWVYNSPTRKYVIEGEERNYTISLSDVCFVLSLPLRDRYLSIHPEISVE